MNDKTDRENQEFEAMYNALEQIDVPRRKIMLSEFIEFLPLYQQLPDGKVPMPGSEEAIQLHRLSQKFSQRVNVRKPLELIDDATGEVIVELPAHWTTTKLLTQTEIKKNENFNLEASHDFPGVADKAHQRLQASFIISQALESSALTEIRKSELRKELQVLQVLNPEKFKNIVKTHLPDAEIKQNTAAVVTEDEDLEFTVE